MEKNFASDNNSGVHERVMEAMIKVNKGHAKAYGEDTVTLEAIELIKKKLGAKAAFFTLNGTGTNITVIDSLVSKYGAILCTDLCHIFVHETGAAAKAAGIPILTVPSSDGKLNVNLLDKYLQHKKDYHCTNPEIITIAQTTEMGTVYTPDEIKEIVRYAHKHGFKVHMDGARISNACAKLGLSLKEMTGDLGIDALSLGMCKNGLMFGECAVFFDHEHEDFKRCIKSNLQLQSKSRYVAAQYIEILKDDLWRDNADNANKMCDYMFEQLSKFKEVKPVSNPDSNMIFVQFPPSIIRDLQNFMDFYLDNEYKNYSRLVFSFDTTKEDVDNFIQKIGELLGK